MEFVGKSPRSLPLWTAGIAILFVSVWLFAAPPARADNVPSQITISTGDYPPFNSQTMKHGGLILRIVTEAFGREGISVDYVFYPWARAYEVSKAGAVDGTAHWYDSEERRRHHLYSTPIFRETIVWFHLKETPFVWSDLESLAGLRIGAVRGYTYTKEFYDLIEAGSLHVEFVSDDDQNYRKLLARRIDIVPEVVDVGLFLINRTYPPETAQLFTQHSRPFVTNESYLLLSKTKPYAEALMTRFNRGMAALHAEGLIEEYLLESREGRYHSD